MNLPYPMSGDSEAEESEEEEASKPEGVNGIPSFFSSSLSLSERSRECCRRLRLSESEEMLKSKMSSEGDGM